MRPARPRRRAVSAIAAALAMAAVCLTVSCVTEDPGPEKEASCAELGAGFFRDSADQGHYRVVSPNGGEAFKVGDTLKVVVASGPADSEAVIQLAFTMDGALKLVPIPGLPNRSINTRSQCRIGFVVPDSLESGFGGKFSLVSDSVRIRIAWYNHETYRDFSDGYFRITR